eukprot:4347332-Prymnesium_polylepis.1
MQGWQSHAARNGSAHRAQLGLTTRQSTSSHLNTTLQPQEERTRHDSRSQSPGPATQTKQTDALRHAAHNVNDHTQRNMRRKGWTRMLRSQKSTHA